MYTGTRGAVRGQRQARSYQAQADQQAEQSVEAQEAYAEDKVENFKKAFSVCLEAKEYMVRY
jgi:F0F1-type ATP synthase membrane subunit b/b'